jgi:hypothetical protein
VILFYRIVIAILLFAFIYTNYRYVKLIRRLEDEHDIHIQIIRNAANAAHLVSRKSECVKVYISGED